MRFFNYSLEEKLFIKNEIEKVSNFLILNVVNVSISGYLDKEREDFLVDFMSNYIFNIEFGLENNKIVLFELDSKTTTDNQQILDIISNNNEFYHNHLNRVAEVRPLLEYNNEVLSYEIPTANLGNIYDYNIVLGNFLDLFNEAKCYSQYIKNPIRFKEARPDLKIYDVKDTNDFGLIIPYQSLLVSKFLQGFPPKELYINIIPHNTNILDDERMDLDNVVYGGEGLNLFLAIMNFQKGLFPINIDSKEYYYHSIEVAFKRKLKMDIPVYLTIFNSKKDLVSFVEKTFG